MVCCAVVGLMFPGLDANGRYVRQGITIERRGIYTFFVLFGWFVNYCTMLQASKIKHSYTAISATAHEDVNTVGAKSHVKNFFIMRYQLRFGCQSGDVPYRTCRVDARCDDQAWR
jgi:hypothetical protein